MNRKPSDPADDDLETPWIDPDSTAPPGVREMLQAARDLPRMTDEDRAEIGVWIAEQTRRQAAGLPIVGMPKKGAREKIPPAGEADGAAAGGKPVKGPKPRA